MSHEFEFEFKEDERNKCFLNGAHCPHADEAADRAVKKVFAILGVDVDEPKAVREFQESLRFSEKLNRGADHGFLAFIGLLVVAMAAALWAGVVSKVGGH